MRIAIVEDDYKASKSLRNMLEKYAHEKDIKININEFDGAISFINSFKSNFDIIFMDINMPVMNGMDAAKELRKIDENVILYFITNMAQYAINGYEVGAIDFLVKPVTYYQLKLKLEKALMELKRKDNDKIVVVHKNGMLRISTHDIYFIEVLGHHLCYHTIKGNFTSYGTLKEVFNKIQDPLFLQCNRCYVINLRYVNEINDQTVRVENDTLQISRNRKATVIRALSEYMGGKI